MHRPSLVLTTILVLTAAPLGAQAIPLEPGATDWELTGDATIAADGLRLVNGTATYGAAAFRDGTIEFDMRVTASRSFAYLHFRMQSAREHEEIYFRTHKSRLPDAIQYAPVWHGVSNWQLYHGPGGTAAVALPPDTWIHVRLVVSGSRAALYVGDQADAALVMSLARDPLAGAVGFRSFVPGGGTPPATAAMTVRNIVLTPAAAPPVLPELEPVPVPDGVITQWAVSAPFTADSTPARTLPTVASWQVLPSDARGVLVLSRYLPRPAGTRWPGVLARVTLRADRARLVPLELGWSDVATVFLNGSPIFSGDDSYRFDRPRREGLIGFDQGTIFLPLRAGANELVVLVSDTFGGWGIMGRLPDQTGVTISAGP